jgi:23S rRNA (cytidine1920-2'-O)/16S rRNA (cytidine1409-2'-O)-methyltransferase
MRKKIRADQLLHEQGLADSREQAKRLIMAGRVRIIQDPAGTPADKPGSLLPPAQRPPGMPVDKPGRLFPPDMRFAVTPVERFVGRGAYKLLTAVEHFSLDVAGFVVLDAGASTGGFTDCLLQRGAARVYAADVGRNRLHERLRSDARVIPLEGVNLRLADASLVPEDLDMVTADLSFISLTLVLGPCTRRLKSNGLLAALIKPQFEAEPGATVRGVVRDPSVRDAAVDKVSAFVRDTLGMRLLGIVPSAVKGACGNQEYMAVWRKTERGCREYDTGRQTAAEADMTGMFLSAEDNFMKKALDITGRHS